MQTNQSRTARKIEDEIDEKGFVFDTDLNGIMQTNNIENAHNE